MVPHMKVRKGNTVYLLLRYGEQFRFVTANERLTEAMERHILSALCEDSELDMLRLSYERLPVAEVWSYAMSSTKEGAGLLLYVGDEVRNYRLHESCTAEDAAALLKGILPFAQAERPEPVIPQFEDWRLDRQDPRVLRWIRPFTRCWNGVAAFFSLGTLFLGGTTAKLICTLIVPLTWLLYLLLPQYYSISFEEEYQKQGYTAPVQRSFWTWGIVIPSFCLSLRCIYGNHLDLPYYYYLIALAITLLPFFFRCVSREMRDHRGISWLLALFMVWYAFAAPLFVDRYLADDDPPPQPYEVVEKNYHVGKGRDYSCSVMLNGELEQVWVSEDYYDTLQPGDTVMVVYNRGALGFEYAYAVEDIT